MAAVGTARYRLAGRGDFRGLDLFRRSEFVKLDIARAAL